MEVVGGAKEEEKAVRLGDCGAWEGAERCENWVKAVCCGCCCGCCC